MLCWTVQIERWMRNEMISARGCDGGRDRDRTCDPYHVKVVPATEPPEIRTLTDPGSVVFGTMLPGCSAFQVH
jgi:hypothetical protein